MRVTFLHPLSLWPFHFLFNHFHVSSFSKPIPPKPNYYSKDQDTREDYHPCELITEKVGCLFKQPIFAEDVLSIYGY